MQMLYVLQSNRNYNKIFTIDRDRMLYLQFCIPYRKNYEYNMSRGIIWMYYAHMSLRLLLHYGMEILLEYMYIVIHMYIIRIYIFSFYYSHFYRLTYTPDLMSLLGFYSRQQTEYLVAFDGIIFDYF